MRPTMRVRVKVWAWMLDRLRAGKSIRLGLWACKVLTFWDNHLTLWYKGRRER